MRTYLKTQWYNRILLCSVLACTVLFANTLVGRGQTTIEVIYLAGAEATEDAYRALTEAFEAANPDIRVDRIRVQSNYEDRLIALIASGTVPDVIALDMNYLMSFGDERFLYDLNALIARTPDYDINMLARPLVDLYTVDGKLFAAPSSANPSAYVYNLDLFNQAGLAHPLEMYANGDWTWDAFRDLAMKLTRKAGDGSTAVMGAAMHLPRTWIASNGGREFDDPKRPTEGFYDKEEAMEAIRFCTR